MTTSINSIHLQSENQDELPKAKAAKSAVQEKIEQGKAREKLQKGLVISKIKETILAGDYDKKQLTKIFEKFNWSKISLEKHLTVIIHRLVVALGIYSDIYVELGSNFQRLRFGTPRAEQLDRFVYEFILKLEEMGSVN